MTKNKRFTVDIDNENGYDEEPYFCNGTDSFYMDNADEMELFIKEINELVEENKELKDEILLLKEGLKSYENAIPYVCTCSQVRDIDSEMFDFRMKQNKFYKEHPNRCTVIIDGVRYE